jgi:hypothetical protein
MPGLDLVLDVRAAAWVARRLIRLRRRPGRRRGRACA